MVTTHHLESGLIDDTQGGPIRHETVSDIRTRPGSEFRKADKCHIFCSVPKTTHSADNLSLSCFQCH